MAADTTLRSMVEKQMSRVLRKGQRFERFDQIRNRHFWSKYLFAYGAGNPILAGTYDIFTNIPSQMGQGYPVPLTLRETNWKNSGRVPDNQNFVITELGCRITRPPPSDTSGSDGAPANAPANGIWENIPDGIQALVNGFDGVHPNDAANALYGMNLEMTYLTNSVPLGKLADFSQSSGCVAYHEAVTLEADLGIGALVSADPTNGVPAAAFRRKLEIPILLQHGEAMSMRLNVARPIETLSLAQGGIGWFEVHVDWWAVESFVEKS